MTSLPAPLSARELKRACDFVALVSHYTKLRRVGSQFVGCCPIHGERNPSFYVEPQRKIFKCFGCGAGGDLFAFVMRIEDCSFSVALRIVAGVADSSEARRAERFGIGVGAKPPSPAKPGTKPSRDSRAEALARLEASERRCAGIERVNAAALAELATACEPLDGGFSLLVTNRITGHE